MQLEVGRSYIYKEPGDTAQFPRFYVNSKGRILKPGEMVTITKIVETRTRLFGNSGRPVVDFKIGIKGCCRNCEDGNLHHMFSVAEGEECPYFEEVQVVDEKTVSAVDVIVTILELTEYATSSVCEMYQRTVHSGPVKYIVTMKGGTPSSLMIEQKNSLGTSISEVFGPADDIPMSQLIPLTTLYDQRKPLIARANALVYKIKDLLKKVKEIEHGTSQEVSQATAVN